MDTGTCTDRELCVVQLPHEGAGLYGGFHYFVAFEQQVSSTAGYVRDDTWG